MFVCRKAQITDIPSWLEIAQEVEPLFGPMPDFPETLALKIESGMAICAAAGGSSQILGGCLIGRDSERGWIRWLAVRESARKNGIGASLLSAALYWLNMDAVSVLTFCEDVDAGRPARHLYGQFGFEPAEVVVTEGQPRQLFSMHRRSVGNTTALGDQRSRQR